MVLWMVLSGFSDAYFNSMFQVLRKKKIQAFLLSKQAYTLHKPGPSVYQV